MITLPNVPAYSFGRAKKKSKIETCPGPADYNWDLSKQKLLKKTVGTIFPKSRLSRFDLIDNQRDYTLPE